MDLVFCEWCGAVFNGEILRRDVPKFSDLSDEDLQKPDVLNDYEWDGDSYVRRVRCPRSECEYGGIYV